MAKFLSRLFSSGSSSSKRSSFRGSQSSINESGRQTGASSNMRSATSLENLSSYHINPKELEKNKLHKASWEGNMDKVTRLAQPGQINSKDQYSRTALHLAVVRGHLGVVKHLVHEGARLDVIDSEQRTPLVKAVLSGNQNPPLNYQICTVLLQGGADSFINAVDIHGKNALHYAIDFANEDLVALFLNYPSCDANFRDRDQMTPLHLAVKRNNPNIVQILLSDEHQQQVDPNSINRTGQTPLHMAASVGYIEVIRSLLQANPEEPCDPTIADPQQLTAYQVAKTYHHDTCAKLIEEYQQGWTRLAPPRESTGSINEQEINPIVTNPSQRFNDDDDDDDSVEDTSSEDETQSSKQTKQTSNQWSDRTVPSTKQESRSLADMIKNNPLHTETTKTNVTKSTNQTISNLTGSIPLQPDLTRTNATKPTNQTLSNLTGSIPLQPDLTRTNAGKSNNQTVSNMSGHFPLPSDLTKANVSKPTNQTLSNLTGSIPLQPDLTETNATKSPNQTVNSLINKFSSPSHETTSSRPTIVQQKQPASSFGIGSLGLQHKETDHTFPPTSIEKSLIAANPLIGQTSLSPQKNATAGSLLHALPQPEAHVSNSNSWTHDTASSQKQDQVLKQAKRIETWDESSTTQSEDEDTGVYRPKSPLTSFPKSQPASALNGSAMFTTLSTNDKRSVSESDEDSIEAAVARVKAQTYSVGTQNLVNTQIGNNFKQPQPTPFSTTHSPRSEDSSWTTSSITPDRDQANKGVHSLAQAPPLLNKKSSEFTLDDSRPLSADLERNSVKSKTRASTSSESSDEEHDKKSATIVKSPLTGGILSNIVQTNIRPTESAETKTTGVENLAKIIHDVMHRPTTNQKQLTPPSTAIGTLLITPMIKRSDSLSSNASSLIDDTVRSLAIPTMASTKLKQQIYHDDPDEQTWSTTKNDGHDLKLTTPKYSTEMTHPAQRQSSHTLLHHEFNSLRGSMSSSTSSIQNNMERLSELKEDIKQIERKQEDSLELKRQLKDMEIKKNNFEALYKKNDQLLRETETKLEREITEKQRLEWTTKNLNTEFKNVKQKLQSLEDEKDMLNQRCIKLKEERDNYDEKLRIHQTNSLQSTAAGVLREEDIEKIKYRHREEMKLLSAENDDLHQRTKQLQSDLQLHKESLDVTIRYKIDLEKALDERNALQMELERLKSERNAIEKEKIDYKNKYDNLKEEIRVMLLDRSKLEQKLTDEAQEQIKQRQRSTDDTKKYRTQIEQLNTKLGDAEARLLVLQTQNEALIASKDRGIKTEFETLTHRLNIIETEKSHAEQRYQNEHKELISRQDQQRKSLHEPLVILTSTPLTHASQHQHSPSLSCNKCDTLQRSYEHERDHRLQTEKDNERLRDVVSRQTQQHEMKKPSQQHQENERIFTENSKQIRSDTERVKYELDRLRHDFDRLVSNYEPPQNLQQQSQLHSQIDTLRQFYEQEFRQKQQLLSKLNPDTQPTSSNVYHHRTASPIRHDGYDHSPNGSINCSRCSNSRLLKERLEQAIDSSLADQRIQTIKQMSALPRHTSPVVTSNNNAISSADYLRQRYYL